ncbi:MAG: glycosyltransferase family 2 protein [Pseudomonadota bacterium]
MDTLTGIASVSVIIVNYNAGDRLAKCLSSLAGQSAAPKEIFVVDNASSDNSMALAAPHLGDAHVMMMDDNLGFAAANNRAVDRATGDWVAFLNPDAYPDKDWIKAFVQGVQTYPEVDAFGSTQLAADDPSRLDGLGDAYFFGGVAYRGGFHHPRPDDAEDAETFAACAAAAFYRREAFLKLGGFDESFFCYVEDVDLGFRLRLAGGRTLQLADAIVAHEGSGITGRHSDFSIYHGHRNRVVTHLRNMPAVLLVPTLPVHLVLNMYLAIRFSFRGGVRAYLRAMRDAIGMVYANRDRRRELQSTRKISILELATALTWSPVKLATRSPDLRPVGSCKAAAE